MPSSQAAASERRNDKTVAHEPPKLKTTLKTPPKQATNPLQFVKVGPCSLYRSAQEQLQKVQETKKIKQEVRDDPEDWQSNLDNWKSSRRKRQEHIIERVVEVKKLELEEHDRQRRRSKTFSEMMEERGSRGRKLSMSLAMYHEDDVNDLSDLGIGTSSGKSSVSGDTHDDMHSVLSDRDSEMEKNHSDVENPSGENDNANDNNNAALPPSTITTTLTTTPTISIESPISKRATSLYNHHEFHNDNDIREYDSANTATASSPEPEEYACEGAIRAYMSRVSQNLTRRTLNDLQESLDGRKFCSNEEKLYASDDDDDDEEAVNDSSLLLPVVTVDVHKRREIFEKTSSQNSLAEIRANNINNNNNNNNNNNDGGNGGAARSSANSTNSKAIEERLSSLEIRNTEMENEDADDEAASAPLSNDMNSIRERLSNLEKKTSEYEMKHGTLTLECSRPLRERLASLEKYGNDQQSRKTTNNEIAPSIKDNIVVRTTIEANDSAGSNEQTMNKKEATDAVVGKSIKTATITSTASPSERSSSPDSEYRVLPRATFHTSLDSLDADGSSGPDTFERVHSLEELDYTARYPASSSSAELLHDTDREDSGIHTADVSCSVSQADEPVDEEVVRHPETIFERQETCLEASDGRKNEISNGAGRNEESILDKIDIMESPQRETAVTFEERSIVDEASEHIEIREDSPVSVVEEEAEEEEEARPNATRSVSSKRNKLQHQHQHLSEIGQESEMSGIDANPANLQPYACSVQSLFDTPSASSKQIPQLNLTSDEELVNGSMTFPLGPPSSAEPPKEKPPPPPTDLSDDEEHGMPVEPLKRLNSTRRIKKELRTRRSDFLGIEGMNDDYLERELRLTKPPDMAAILAEERRIEQLNRRSYDTDSNYERDSSHERDSGVELGHAEEWSKQPVSPDMSQHSRQSSEPFGASVTSSEEDEITKKEREIIEILEKEEQWRYGNDREHNRDIGEKLAHKLRQLEEEKMQLERERVQETALRRRQEERETARLQQKTAEEKRIRDDELSKVESQQSRIREEMEEENERRSAEARRQEEARIRSTETMDRETSPRKQMVMNNGHEDEVTSGEVRRVERELLQLEQEELKRRRTNVAYRQQKQLQLAEQLHQQWQSLQDVARGTVTSPNNSPRYKYQAAPIDYRSSMPNLQLQEHHRRRPPPPPIPPSKPSRLVEQMQRDVSIRNSRMPSADSIPQQVDAGLGHGGSLITLANHPGQQQMTKQTLQALSAVPRSRILKGDQWVQRRKSDIPRGTHEYNYQHWLIQEAEQRRINEKNHRSTVRKAGQQHATGTSVPYTAVAQSSSRFDGKPLPDSIIQTLTQRVQNRTQERPPPPPPPPPAPHRRRLEQSAASHEHLSSIQHQTPQHVAMLQHQKVHQFSTSNNTDSQEKMLSVSGKKKCSHCGDELGRGAAMIIESLRLFYHMECFKCCVCHVRLGDGLMGTDVRVRNHKLHCHNCYSSDDGVKFSCV